MIYKTDIRYESLSFSSNRYLHHDAFRGKVGVIHENISRPHRRSLHFLLGVLHGRKSRGERGDESPELAVGGR
jgi:hypothetical protein